MAILGAFTLIRGISLFHITAAYFFLTAPRTIVDQNAVYMLGESLRLPHITSLDKPNEASALIAILFGLLGVADLTAASMHEIAALEYWTSNVPTRLCALFGLTGYVYLFKEDGIFGSPSMLRRRSNPGENLRNSFVFTFGFLEISVWFWILVKLREERQRLAQKRIDELKAQENRL